uniref:E3 ubiquitin-protein ligase CCNB1IP1-like n=1 Tax=Myxine glutinosa TaxID=7769 RepID=UPI00358E782C
MAVCDEDLLLCNMVRCRARLSGSAWVTSCSHIFCDEDGSREFHKAMKCPACGTILAGKFDIIRMDISPTDEYKAMVLAGLRPDVIMEICSRALAFWTYQIHQERMSQDHLLRKAHNRISLVENQFEQQLETRTTEVSALKREVGNLRRELDQSRRRCGEVTERLMDRNRQQQKLQAQFDSLRRRTSTLNSKRDREQISPRAQCHIGNFDHPFGSTQRLLRPFSPIPYSPHQVPCSNQDFVLNPVVLGCPSNHAQNLNYFPKF